MLKVALADGADDAIDFFLDREFDGPVGPLHHRAEMSPRFIDDGAEDEAKASSADLDIDLMGRSQVLDDRAIVRGILVEGINIRANQRCRVEVGKLASDGGLMGLEHPLQAWIDIDDVAATIGDHHHGVAAVKRGTKALGFETFLTDRLQRPAHRSDLIASIDAGNA